ncbi:hypothetical protein AJ79_05060 [Helicocarpus griseus UAMH5409]|uniref:Atos-like conserved domain-containing protein n=1 Tax=Helicocarpus griseus UAMH5409 TaxID=1447875 RepID=A0A2B7XQ69_9EURO|nr:hypothetical protein AJ79_05060 [Helicocarpus griseus UAMH5409]
MPIFKDQDRQEPRHHSPWPQSSDGDLRDIRPSETPEQRVDDVGDEVMTGTSSGASMDAYSSQRLRMRDREELIRLIKKGESPTWVPNRALEDYFAKHGDPPHSRLEGQLNKERTPPLLPPAQIDEPTKQDATNEISPGRPGCPWEIERPRSALHSGDFREGSPQNREQPDNEKSLAPQHSQSPYGSSPWYPPTSPPRPTRQEVDSILARSRARAPSLSSFSSSFVLKAPTSPLVHQANNTDLDFSPRIEPMDLSASPEKANRRRTLPPETFTAFQSSLPGHTHGSNVPAPRSWRREATFPYQAHQPRKSLTSAYTLQPAPSSQSAFMLRPSRSSFSPDVSSPLYHAPMVGSYEESILRGRMSTSPSKPLDFTAQIGVLGRGNCKSNLKCPPHVTVPFPAVFYSYPTSGDGRSISDDSPSPYVGYIDIENTLPREDRANHRSRRRHGSPFKQVDNRQEVDTSMIEGVTATTQQERRRREKRSRRSSSPKSPPGGCYRIPQQGQLQIIIKNPNKTAVKLFLVPYDLEGMEPGTKTFIRQRSYSVGPVIDMPLSARTNLGTDRPEASLSTSEDPADKPILRYLIHLNICCPSRGRFYLYSGIRVVFANRVPDGKEKLRNEVQYPDPRYSPYKPTKESGSNNAGSKLAAEKAFRRRSSGYGHTLQPALPTSVFEKREHNLYSRSPTLPPLDTTINFNFPIHSTNTTKALPDAPSSVRSSPSPNVAGSTADAENLYSKRQRGNAGYGGSSGNEVGESLLARKLKSLDVMIDREAWDED